jgi:Holliday junction resolvasome RuvABC endonuclease subunit
LLLSLDISTSCTGWCVFNVQNDLEGYGFINLSKHKGLYEKASKVKAELLNMLIRYNIQEVAVEENLQAFRPGLSSAKTLMTLAQFNGVVRWLCHSELNVPVYALNVNAARKSVGLKIDRKSTRKTKDQVYDWVSNANMLNNEVTIRWPTKILKSGPNKGRLRTCDEAYDIADAFVIGKSHFILKNSQ